MTEKDGTHVTIFFLLKGGEPMQIVNVAPESQQEKYLLMRELAHAVTKLDADAIIMIGEAWHARANLAKPYIRASDAPDRDEILMATLVRKIGEPVQLIAKFLREGKRVSLGETKVEKDGVHFLFAPVYEAWGRSIPANWRPK
jgi:hypothetical protein